MHAAGAVVAPMLGRWRATDAGMPMETALRCGARMRWLPGVWTWRSAWHAAENTGSRTGAQNGASRQAHRCVSLGTVVACVPRTGNVDGRNAWAPSTRDRIELLAAELAPVGGFGWRRHSGSHSAAPHEVRTAACSRGSSGMCGGAEEAEGSSRTCPGAPDSSARCPPGRACRLEELGRLKATVGGW